ncbi:armadillo-type protein, partial [Fomitopsis serialis]|uniref:armadillo-type protein n=1 Tax=Fomitopsis serialis TaxID=139415 RepID=UPI002008DB5E
LSSSLTGPTAEGSWLGFYGKDRPHSPVAFVRGQRPRMPVLQDEDSSQATFKTLKSVCVPLMGNSQLSPTSIPMVSKLLAELVVILRQVEAAGAALRPSIISYIFFPLSTIMRRNTLSSIPDQIMERIFIVLNGLCESWWWDFDETTWEQIFMLCGAVLGGIDSKGKSRVRDDETKEAATRCLYTLLRERFPDEDPLGVVVPPRCERISRKLQFHARTKTFIPILGQTVDSLLLTAESSHLPLQKISLKVLRILTEAYLPEDFIPSVLPGIISASSKIALGVGTHKGWTNGDIVSTALDVMQAVIVKSVGDEVCKRHGAVRSLDSLEDLLADADTLDQQALLHSAPSPYSTARTASWLRGTASQLHIAMNALTPLSQGLLLSFLLSLFGSPYNDVANRASNALTRLLSPTSSARHSLLQTLLHISRDSLASLPRFIATQSDSKVEHLASLIESVCKLAMTISSERRRISVISTGVGKLLGPTGGIEKWGWSLLSVLDFGDAPITVTRANAAQRVLESSEAAGSFPFPPLVLNNVTSPAAQSALERMFRAMGAVAGDDGLFAVEWFLGMGQNGRGSSAVSALWCAGGVTLDLSASLDRSPVTKRSKRVEKLARGIAKRVADSWTDIDDEDVLQQQGSKSPTAEDDSLLVEHIKGLLTIRRSTLLHKALSLQLLSITAGILEAHFSPLLLHTLYPILHSVVSESPLVSTTGTATLHFVATMTSYASSANMLLSNFDYALDSVSRRLSRRWLDVDATKVLAALVRLVGRDAVQKAGDVVEECFDRLDEYHGYEMIVDGLIEVLSEVVKVVEEEDSSGSHRGRQRDPVEEDRDNSGDDSYPREAWGKAADAEEQMEPTEPVPDPTAEPPPTPSQALTKQIVSRSLYFLTHGAPTIRARILLVLSSAVPVLPASALLPSVHHAWPFILNRLNDQEPFVVSAAAALIESLSTHVGDFMHRRIWDDIWPRFQKMLEKLRAADADSALARRGPAAVGTESAYTVSHRLYRSMLKTMTAAVVGVRGQDSALWDVTVLFRRFLHGHAHEELQACARDLYAAITVNNEDAVWLALSATQSRLDPSMDFLSQPKWSINENV